MAAPVHAVGEVVTASRINSWFINTLYAAKTATESVVSSTAFQDDDDLTVAVEANCVYDLAVVLNYDGHVSGDFKSQTVLPAGATIAGQVVGIHSGAASANDVYTTAWDGGAVNAGGLGAGTTCAWSGRGLLTVAGTAGTCKLQWAQIFSHATATRLFAGSYLVLRRVA
jgi:hypothetical protein